MKELLNMDYSALYEKINYKFRNDKLLTVAFTHPSIKVASSKILTYDRLEFLGDALLNFIVSDVEFGLQSNKNSGELTKLRQKHVSNKNLARAAKKLELEKYLIKNNSFDLEKSEKIFADIYEALVAAIYKDSSNINVVYKFVVGTLLSHELEIEDNEVVPESYRAEINEYCQKNKFKCEMIDTQLDVGTFKTTLIINDISISGEGHSKKKAEEEACKNFYYNLILEGEHEIK